MKIKAIILFAFILFFCVSLVIAQSGDNPTVSAPRPSWGTYGTEVCNAPGNTPQQNPRIIPSAAGNYFIVWEDGRAGLTKVYAQKIDSAGRKLWGEGGVALCSINGNQNNPRAIADNSGGLIIAWQGYYEGTADIYAQHVGVSGQILWGSTGTIICRAAAGQFAPELVTDGAGGAIITWHDYRSAGGEDVYAQRIDSAGTVLWQENGIPICASPGTQWYPQICQAGAGRAIITWTDGRGGAADNNIYAQLVDQTGKVLWEKDGVPVCSAPGNQERPVILSVDKWAIIAWNDSRSGDVNIYAQKIDLDGKPLWDSDGVAVTTAPFSQSNPKLAPDGLGGAVLAWTDNREEETSIFTQRLNGTGKIMWGENGRPLAAGSGNQEYPEIVDLPGNEWVVVFQDFRKGTSLIFAQKINSAGTALWSEGGLAVCPAGKGQEKVSITPTENKGVIVVWQDRRQGNFDLFSQNISSTGVPSWDPTGLVLCNAPGAVIHQNAKLVGNDLGETIIVFEDARFGYLNIFAQKVNKAGTLMWGKNGLVIAKIKADQTNPQIVTDGAGGAIVCWEDQRSSSGKKIFCQRITSAGKRVWEKGSIALTSLNSKQANPVMAPDESGGAIIIWEEERDPLSLKDLYGQRISGSGDLLWGRNGLPVCRENGDQIDADLVKLEAGKVAATWTDYRRGDRNPDIYVQSLNGTGKAVWKEEGVLVCGAPDIQRMPKIAVDSEGGVIVAWTDKGGGSYDIYAQRLGKDGGTLWLTDGIPVSQSARTQQNPVLCPLPGKELFVWEDYRYGNWDLFSAGVSLQGKLVWGSEGIAVTSAPLTQYAPQIAPLGNSAVLAWEDYRSGKQYEVYLQQIDANGKRLWPEGGEIIKTTDGARSPKLLALPKQNAFVVVWEDYTTGNKALFGQRFTVD